MSTEKNHKLQTEIRITCQECGGILSGRAKALVHELSVQIEPCPVCLEHNRNNAIADLYAELRGESDSE